MSVAAISRVSVAEENDVRSESTKQSHRLTLFAAL
jgi:hypothetical protein